MSEPQHVSNFVDEALAMCGIVEKTTYHDFMRKASGWFLHEPFPPYWREWDQNVLLAWCRDNPSQEYEYVSGRDILHLIKSLAKEFHEVHVAAKTID